MVGSEILDTPEACVASFHAYASGSARVAGIDVAGVLGDILREPSGSVGVQSALKGLQGFELPAGVTFSGADTADIGCLPSEPVAAVADSVLGANARGEGDISLS